MKQRVVITGAARGIGREVAKLLAESGDTVIGLDRDKKGIEALKGELDGIGAPHFLRHVDVTDRKGVAAFRDEVIKEFDGVDIVVSNAAVASFGSFEETDLDGALECLRINVLGAATILSAFIPSMRKSGKGRLIQMSSFVGIVPFPFESIDSACNFAVEGLVGALRLEVEPFGIEVGLIEPGIVLTGITADVHKLPPEGSPYRDRIARFLDRDRQMKKNAMTPERAAQKIVKIIRAKRLRLHNRIDPMSAFFLSIERFLPMKIMDMILINQMDIKP